MENKETTIVDGIEPLYEVDFLIERRKHIYVIGGSKYASVTNVLGIIGGQKLNALMAWSKRVALNYVSDEDVNIFDNQIEFLEWCLKVEKNE